ncbi:TIGR03986 family type III CRISPR-associated RAMP protein [Thermomonas flagellata]|uniref:TIGR03986 family type III CRISPR-associated RAMP protein n=1 Tax=Thermomonas flagellata TaxID=2888524 RepID=UPI001F03C5E6|nr:TIGR03986 family CRISPR-associated RAMP protein [Thermomonas flagellata]
MIPIPYGFLPIDPARSIHDAPLWRDGSSDELRYSGELLITLTALTPLIVGNHQHALDEKHSLLLPQMLDDGRVLIGASSLKGMLRASLSSLLHAPMERVAEHHYTYRPNLGFGGNKPKAEPRAAVVEPIKNNGEGPTATITIRLLPSDCAVVFVREEAVKKLGPPAAGGHIQRTIPDVELTGRAPRMRLDAKRGQSARLDHHFFLYRGGIDGSGHLAEAFRSDSRVYQAVLVPASDYQKAQTLSIPEKILRAYYQTQQILADTLVGHLSPGYPNLNKLENLDATRRDILAHVRLQVGQLIYVEIEQAGKSCMHINSMGHHFYYRWAYSSSVRYKNRLLDGKGQLRAELALHPDEHADPQGVPHRLTGARLLFGYAVDGRDDMQAGLAGGNFKRLAGRIAFNTAIEYPENKTPDSRFIGGGREIQLRVLGMPRPSAVEFYLKQTGLPGKLTTYGDLPGDPGGDLAGRKFYRHQPDAAKTRQPYSPGSAKSQNDTNTQERGTCVRYLSAPGSHFRCTLRFDSLRPWELGALLAALDPGLIESAFGLSRYQHGYAHKLGYGKPLGLGSVRLRIDKARWQESDSWKWRQSCSDEALWQGLQAQALDALKKRLQASWTDDKKRQDHLAAWLKARRWALKGSAAYPTEADKDGNETIYNYHTALRRAHAAARRGDDHKRFDELKKLLESGR